MTETILKTKTRWIFLSIRLFLEIIPKKKKTFQIVSLETLEVKISMYICGFHFPPLFQALLNCLSIRTIIHSRIGHTTPLLQRRNQVQSRRPFKTLCPVLPHFQTWGWLPSFYLVHFSLSCLPQPLCSRKH